MLKKLSILALALSTWLHAAPLKVVTSTPDIAWAMREIGGDKVEVVSLLKGLENPHFIDAVPDYIRLVADAKVVCVIGMDLEMGWMPKVLARSGNARVQPGGIGYCEASKGISVLEKPVGAVDRSMGDVHPAGNPHFWPSPDAMAQSAATLREILVVNDPQNSKAYNEGYARLKATLNKVRDRNLAKLKPFTDQLKEPVMIEYHKEFTYFSQVFGIKSFGSIEEKPGVTPSAGRLAEMATSTKNSSVRFILAADTAPRKTVAKFAEMSGLPIVTVPLSLRTNGKPADYPEFIDLLVDSIVAVLKQGKS